MERQPRVDDFLRNIRKPAVRVPDPTTDYHMYQNMAEAFTGVSEYLEDLRRNQGRLGYTAQNCISDLSKAQIAAAIRDDEEEMAFLDNEMYKLAEGFIDVSDRDELAETGNRFSRTIWQEKLEADLFRVIWPVIVEKSDAVPKLISWMDFRRSGGNVQAYLYGYLDVVSELSKALAEEFSKPDMTTEGEFNLFRRYLSIAESITLKLSEYRHIPGYVINNAFGHWASYSTKLRTAYGTIAYVRRDYNLRRSIERMVAGAIAKQASLIG